MVLRQSSAKVEKLHFIICWTAKHFSAHMRVLWEGISFERLRQRVPCDRIAKRYLVVILTMCKAAIVALPGKEKRGLSTTSPP